MTELVFPEGVTYTHAYTTGGDLVERNTKLTTIGNLWRNGNNTVFDIRPDVSAVTSFYCAFNGCSALVAAPELDLSNVTNVASMFASCSSLIKAPEYDLSNVTNITNMFYYCNALQESPRMNCKKATSFDSLFYYCNKLTKIGLIDSDSITNAGYIGGYSSLTSVKDVEGFRNLGKASSVSNTNGSYFLYNLPNLTRQSLINIFNELYDRAANGLSVLTLKLHANHLALLTDEDKAIATNKGWILS